MEKHDRSDSRITPDSQRCFNMIAPGGKADYRLDSSTRRPFSVMCQRTPFLPLTLPARLRVTSTCRVLRMVDSSSLDSRQTPPSERKIKRPLDKIFSTLAEVTSSSSFRW